MEKWKYFNIKFFFLFILIFFFQKIGHSRVSGVCSECHTMHYSHQGGILPQWKEGGPFKALLIGDCVFCHKGTNTGNNKTPYVWSDNPSYEFGGSRNILAGGNFYWVAQNDRKGHNVLGVTNPDTTLKTPPGFKANYGSKGRSQWPEGQQITCAGTYGCHGNPIKEDQVEAILGAHHNNIGGFVDGSDIAHSYRFLLGIKGTEDSKWEYNPNKESHNGYYASTDPTDEASINYLCGECHGKFHSKTYNSTTGYKSPWLRHPTDYDMNEVKDKEYGDYPNVSIFDGKLGVSSQGDYFADVPVGNTKGEVLSQVLKNSGDAIVLCLSCHRAHGSPYDAILRWDYKNWPNVPDNQNGCLACHTTKY